MLSCAFPSCTNHSKRKKQNTRHYFSLISIRISKRPDVLRNKKEDCFFEDGRKNKPSLKKIKRFLMQMLKAKVFFFITCISFTLSVLWLQLATTPNSQIVKDSVVTEAIRNVAQDSRFAVVYRKKNKLPKDLKYILLWTRRDFAPFNYLHTGMETFIRSNCSMINCYITSDRNFFDGDITKFHAIAFNGRTLGHRDLPTHRIPRQKYIYFNTESAVNYPVCDSVFDNYFNWTATYKLDSDIPITYIMIKENGQIVGPSVRMNWPVELPLVNDELVEKLSNKSKAVAWFVSNCVTRSNREGIVSKLRKALSRYGYTVDVYGACGNLTCPRRHSDACRKKLEKDYYFYLSMENSLSEDYVTEKLLTALQHDVIPIVYGGADYSRFLPPRTYLDARKTSSFDLAKKMDRLMNNPSLYAQYFRWKSIYNYSDPWHVENICKICAALNDDLMFTKQTIYKNFREWWLPKYKGECGFDSKRITIL